MDQDPPSRSASVAPSDDASSEAHGDEQSPLVHVVDDSREVCDALAYLLRSADLACRTYASADDFLDQYDPAQPGCLVLDVRLPGMSGMELQAELRRRELDIPIIIMTGHGDVPMAVQALKAGAVDFLEKPCDGQALLNLVRQALDRDAQTRADQHDQATIRARLQALTPREYEVMTHIVRGRLNKQVATKLDVSHRTIEVHRKRVMEKMRAGSLAELVRMVLRVEPDLSDPDTLPPNPDGDE